MGQNRFIKLFSVVFVCLVASTNVTIASKNPFGYSTSLNFKAGQSIEEVLLLKDRYSITAVLAHFPLDEVKRASLDIAKWGINLTDDVLESDSIVPLFDVDDFSGKCPDMEKFHLLALGLDRLFSKYVVDEAPDEIYGRGALIYVGGKLVGFLKKAGNPSMLALRTVKDSQGRYPLILGGVYILPAKIYMAATRKTGIFPRIELDTLSAFPLSLIGKNWNQRGCAFMLSSIKSRTEWYKAVTPELTKRRLELEGR